MTVHLYESQSPSTLIATCNRLAAENLRLEREWRRATRAFRIVCGVAAALWMIAVTLLWRIY